MEDFGDYIYIIVAILFSVVGAIKKKRAQAGVPKPSKSKDLFETFFEDEVPITDPIQEQMEYEEDEFEPHVVEPIIETPEDDFQEVVNRRRKENTSVVEIQKVATSSQKHKRHPILDDIHSPQEIQKAVIYSEILKTKF